MSPTAVAEASISGAGVRLLRRIAKCCFLLRWWSPTRATAEVKRAQMASERILNSSHRPFRTAGFPPGARCCIARGISTAVICCMDVCTSVTFRRLLRSSAVLNPLRRSRYEGTVAPGIATYPPRYYTAPPTQSLGLVAPVVFDTLYRSGYDQ